MSSPPTHIRKHTFVFKRDQGVDYAGDCYLPATQQSVYTKAPVLLYWHGGGLVSGTRDWDEFSAGWLFGACLEAGIAVISLDYTLLGPQSAHHIVDDIRATVAFVQNELQDSLPADSPPLDVNRIAVAGSSAGGYVAYMAAAILPNAFKALVSIYGAGGDLLTDWYLQEKTESFLPGIPLLGDLEPCRKILEQPKDTTPPTVSFPFANRAHPRTLLLLYMLQTGTLVDVLAGEKGFAARLRAVPPTERPKLARELGSAVSDVLPQLSALEHFPPSLLLHGDSDTLVKVHESRALAGELQRAGVDVTLREVEGGDHVFDLADRWAKGPGGTNPELTRKKDEVLESVLPWLLERI